MTRSNRQLTQFAVDKLHSFLNDGNAFQPGYAGNTAVSLYPQGDYSVLAFSLFEQRILEVFFDGLQCSHAVVYDGGFYDKEGRPSRTTRERLNGLLDALGEECLIPERVRVHLDADKQEECYVGRLAVRQRLGQGFQPVVIHSDSVRLTFDT
jgi:hypothetical protein